MCLLVIWATNNFKPVAFPFLFLSSPHNSSIPIEDFYAQWSFTNQPGTNPGLIVAFWCLENDPLISVTSFWTKSLLDTLQSLHILKMARIRRLLQLDHFIQMGLGLHNHGYFRPTTDYEIRKNKVLGKIKSKYFKSTLK